MLIAGFTTELRGVREMKTELKVACLAGAFALATSGALANVTYVYTGNIFTNFQNSAGLFNFGDKVTGEVVLPAALGSNFPFQPVTPLSYSLSAGALTLSFGSSSFSFSTNSSGSVNSWNVLDSLVIIHTGSFIHSSNTTSSIQDEASVGTFFSVFSASNSGFPGFWTLETGGGGGGSVPEPAGWTMMLIGFAGLGFMAYRARRTAAATA
jgi:hypothetical protein